MFKKREVQGLITRTRTDWGKVAAAVFWAVVILAVLGSLGG